MIDVLLFFNFLLNIVILVLSISTLKTTDNILDITLDLERYNRRIEKSKSRSKK